MDPLGRYESAESHTFACQKVCDLWIPAPAEIRKFVPDSFSRMEKCVEMHFSQNPAADRPPKNLLGLMENSLFWKMEGSGGLGNVILAHFHF